jgi:hypothetical protein
VAAGRGHDNQKEAEERGRRKRWAGEINDEFF